MQLAKNELKRGYSYRITEEKPSNKLELQLQFPIETTGEKLMFVNKEGLSGFPYKVIA